MARAKGEPGMVGAEEEPLKHVAVPHVFGIEKDKAGDVWLYNKYLINSDKIKGDGTNHGFGIQFGYYLDALTYGIGFQTNYSGMSQRPLAGILIIAPGGRAFVPGAMQGSALARRPSII